MRITNRLRSPLNLQDGTILAASGTPGATKNVGSLSDQDRRHVDAGRLVILPDDDPRVTSTDADVEQAETVGAEAVVEDEAGTVDQKSETGTRSRRGGGRANA